MAQSVIERVARVIADHIGYSFDESFTSKREWVNAGGKMNGRFVDVNQPYQCDYLDAACAAIEAMREPTEAMIDAVWTQPDANGSQYPIGGYREQYRAMIDAALNEQVAE